MLPSPGDGERSILWQLFFGVQDCEVLGGFRDLTSSFGNSELRTLGTAAPVLRSGLRLIGRLAEEHVGVVSIYIYIYVVAR